MQSPFRLLALLAISLCFAAFEVNAENLKIGTTLALSGPYATMGRQALQGMQMAVEEVNANGGIKGRQVQLLVDDFGDFDLKKAVTATRKFIDVDKIELLFPLIVEDAEAIVNAANGNLIHGGGLARAIVVKGGAVIQDESDRYVAKHGKLQNGMTAVTSGGNLKAK